MNRRGVKYVALGVLFLAAMSFGAGYLFTYLAKKPAPDDFYDAWPPVTYQEPPFYQTTVR